MIHRRTVVESAQNLGASALPFVHQDFVGNAREAAAGDANAQETAEKTSLEIRIEVKRVNYGADFLLGFGFGDASDAFQVAAKKIGPQATDKKRHDSHFWIQGIPKNAFFEVVRLVFKPGAECGSEIAG